MQESGDEKWSRSCEVVLSLYLGFGNYYPRLRAKKPPCTFFNDENPWETAISRPLPCYAFTRNNFFEGKLVQGVFWVLRRG